MRTWADDDNEHVRRLASEGCRPRLPWGIAITGTQGGSGPILPILDRLRADPSEYVRRSVANNLNDIVKDHPDLVLDVARAGSAPRRHRPAREACMPLVAQTRRPACARALRSARHGRDDGLRVVARYVIGIDR